MALATEDYGLFPQPLPLNFFQRPSFEIAAPNSFPPRPPQFDGLSTFYGQHLVINLN
jgi:hypothetical protein